MNDLLPDIIRTLQCINDDLKSSGTTSLPRAGSGGTIVRVSPRRETSDAANETHSDPNTHGRCLEVVVHHLSRSTYHIDECLLEQV